MRKFRIHVEILVILLAVGVRLIPGPRIVDDAYITFRYARNVLGGAGLVYNPGEAVLGTTSPLYALILTGLGSVSGGSQAPLPMIAWLLNTLADGITCWLFIRMADRLDRRNAGLAAAFVWAVAPFSVTFAIGGMETSVLIALMMATLYMYVSRCPKPTALLASLCLLTRPDSLLLVGPLVLERLRQTLPEGRFNRKPIRISLGEIAAFTLPLLAWAAFGFWFYGNPIPHSITAKTAAYLLPPEAGLVRLLQHYATPFLAHETFGLWWIGAGLLLYPVLHVIGSLEIIRRQPETWPMLSYPWIYFAVFALANPLLFRWYLVPPLPMFFLGVFLGIERLGRSLKFHHLTTVFAALAVALSLRTWRLHPDHGPDRPAPEMAFIRLELLYEQVAIALVDEIQPGQVLAAGDIGTLGYLTDAPILDTVGLISTEATRYYPLPAADYEINYAIPTRLITDLEPDYLVILEVYGRHTLLRDPEFEHMYTRIETIPTDMYGSEGMLIYARSALD
ncbi:MAG TPA: hypothetical protein G4O08_01855 [Anaerolineae bacterium]|nr:hypothetical protein [Anaerolineae bacterium]